MVTQISTRYGIILDSSKERLKDILRILESIVNRDYLLEFNNKTKIYKSTEGFNFLGISYQVKNNKISRRIVSKTRRRLLKKNIKYCFKYEKQYLINYNSYDTLGIDGRLV